MRKILLSLFCIPILSALSFAQEGLFQFSKSYFRPNPFVGSFSSFIVQLLNDPSLLEKESQKRTDTSLFYFSGTYKNYNPFFFKPKQVKIVLHQASVNYGDSLATDTIFIYQLLAYADNTEKNQQDIKKEFEKIHRIYHKKFYDSNYKDLKDGANISGALHNYFVAYSALAPLTITWATPENELVLSLILRFTASENRAIVIESL